MASQRSLQFASLGVPHPDTPVFGAARELVCARQVHQAEDLVFVTDESLDSSIRNVPGSNGLVRRAAHQHAIGQEQEAAYFSTVRVANRPNRFFWGQIPDFDCTIERSACQQLSVHWRQAADTFLVTDEHFAKADEQILFPFFAPNSDRGDSVAEADCKIVRWRQSRQAAGLLTENFVLFLMRIKAIKH